MKITYSNRVNELITRSITLGQKLVGIRVESFTIESEKEFNILISEKGLRWARHNLNFRPITYVPKESNWGSDWVDDGV